MLSLTLFYRKGLPFLNEHGLFVISIYTNYFTLSDFIFVTIILDFYFSIYEFKDLLILDEESYEELFHYFLNNIMIVIENHYNISLHIEGMSECGECFKDNIGNTILFLHMLVNRMFELVVIGLIIGTIINKINQKT